MRRAALLVVVMATASSWWAFAGERGTAFLQVGKDTLRLPAPVLDGGPTAPMQQDRNGVGYQGRLRGVGVGIGVELDVKPVSHREFVRLKAETLDNAAGQMRPGGMAVPLSRPELASETPVSQVVLYAPFRARPQPGFGPKSGVQQLCLGRVHIYGRTLTLTMAADAELPDVMSAKMREWVDAIIQANPDGVEKDPTVDLNLPGRARLAIPFPAGFERFADASRELAKPALRFTEADWRDPAPGNRGHGGSGREWDGRQPAAHVIVENPALLEDFKRLLPGIVKVIPATTANEQDRIVVRYTFTGPGGVGAVYGVLARLDNQLLRFELAYPAGNWGTRDELDKKAANWANRTLKANREDTPALPPWNQFPIIVGPGKQVLPPPPPPPAMPPRLGGDRR